MNAQESLATAKRVMADERGKHLGDFVWWSCSNVGRNRFATALTFEGFAGDRMVADETSCEVALARATRSLDDGYFVRPLGRGRVVLVQQHGADVRSLCEIRLDSWLTGVELTPLTSSEDEYRAAEHVASVVAGRIGEQRLTMTGGDLGGLCTKVVDELGGVRLKPSGHVYWVPSVGSNEVRRLRSALRSAGAGEVYVTPVHDSEEARAAVTAAASEQFWGEVNKIEEELETFQQKRPRTTTLEARLARFEELRDHVSLYGDMMSVRAAQLNAALDRARDAVRKLIDESE